MDMKGPVTALVRRYAGRLRYPKLLALTAALFAIDLVVPDSAAVSASSFG